MRWYFSALKKYSDFDGRACRAEYWSVVFVNWLMIFGAPFLLFSLSPDLRDYPPASFIGFLVIYILFMFVPTLAVNVRRLHDTNRTGGYIFICCVPFIGALMLFIFMCLRGSIGNNDYGPPTEKEFKPSPPPGFL